MNDSEDKNKTKNPFDDLFPYESGQNEEKQDTDKKEDDIKENDIGNMQEQGQEKKADNVGNTSNESAGSFEELLDIGNESIINENGDKAENSNKQPNITKNIEEAAVTEAVSGEETGNDIESSSQVASTDNEENTNITEDNNISSEPEQPETIEANQDMEKIIGKEFDIESGRGADEEIPESQFIEEPPLEEENVPFIPAGNEQKELAQETNNETHKPVEESIESAGEPQTVVHNIDLSEITDSLNNIKQSIDLKPLIDSINNLSGAITNAIGTVNDSFIKITNTISGDIRTLKSDFEDLNKSIKELKTMELPLEGIKSAYEANSSSILKEFQDTKTATLGSLKNISDNIIRLESALNKQSDIVQTSIDTTKSTNESVKSTEQAIEKLVEKENELLETRKKDTNISIGMKHNDNGVFLFYNGKYDSAINEFLKSLELYPDNFDCLNNISLAYMKNNQLDKALEYANKAFQINKESFLINNTLGLIYLRMKEFPKSEEYFNTAVKINNNYIEPYINLGHMYKELNKFDKAIEMWEKVIDLDPTNIEIKRKLMELKEGRISE